MNTPKVWTQSSTIWFNIGSLLVAIAGIALATAGLVPEPWVKYLVFLIGVGNIIQRFRTDRPVIINGPVAQVGGTQFTGTAQIGIAAGSVGAVTEASGGTPALADPNDPGAGPLQGGTV